MRLTTAVPVLGLLLVSCAPSIRVSTLWTDVPELAAYVETFNASQRDWQVLVEFKDDAVGAVLADGPKPDLLVARAPVSQAAKEALVPLDSLFGGSLSRASFYKGILDAGLDNDQTRVLPVSFDLPILIYNKTLQPDLAGFSLNLSTLRTLNQQFMAVPSKLPRRMAFSPRWGGFGFTVLHLEGVHFQEGFQGSLAWDPANLNRALADYHSWPSPGWDETADFRRKYLQADPGPSLKAGRIQFFPSTLAAFLSKPWDERRDLDFRFVDRDNVIAASQATVWAGIPAEAASRGAAEQFLAWFFRPDIQAKLIAEDKRQGNFGLADGVPAEVGDALVRAYPELQGRLPASDQVLFWGPLPADWSTLETTALRPWLNVQAASEASLKTAIAKLRDQSGRN